MTNPARASSGHEREREAEGERDLKEIGGAYERLEMSIRAQSPNNLRQSVRT